MRTEAMGRINALSRTWPARTMISWLKRLSDNRLGLTETTIYLQGLPLAADGMSLLHLSDLHLTSTSDIDQIVDVVQSARSCDLVIYTGDYINDATGIPLVAQLLRAMPTGTRSVAVFGNHDHYAVSAEAQPNHTDALTSVFESAGIATLHNDVLRLPEFSLSVVGVDDPVSGFADLPEALRHLEADSPALLLSHTPDLAYELRDWRPLLLLAGHTHGGEICLRGIGAVFPTSRLPRKEQAGLHCINGTRLYVSRGIGYSGIGLRIGSPREIDRLTLRKSKETTYTE